MRCRTRWACHTRFRKISILVLVLVQVWLLLCPRPSSILTKVGGLIILALFAKYWGTRRCLEFFHYFAKRIFPSDRTGGSVFSKLRRFFASYLADGQYDATFLESTLQETFSGGPLFDCVHLRSSGMKLAVTATTISDATLCLFTNYNGCTASPEAFSKPPTYQSASSLTLR
jgi:hypothetical protein